MIAAVTINPEVFMKIIYAFIGAFLIYRLQSILYKRYWNKKLSVTIAFSDTKAVEGDEMLLHETILNQKLLPIPVLKIKYMTSKYIAFKDHLDTEVTDNTYRNDLISVMMYQKLTRSIPFVCQKRGYYTIRNLVLVCSDILLDTEHVATHDLDLYLYVYPKPVDFGRLEIPFQKMLGTILTKRFSIEDPFEFKGIREYQTYDTMKTINWKASAKTGSLMVNVYDHTATQQIKLLLNLEPDTIWRYEDLEEESIRLAAALAARFIEQGIPTSIHTNGPDIISRELVTVPAGSGQNHLKSINEALARIDADSAIPPFMSTLWQEMSASGPRDYIILISFSQKKELQELLLKLIEDKIDFTWIMPINHEIKVSMHKTLIPHAILWDTEQSTGGKV
jgi:uncharacterized protein (DUF58 family)